MTLRKPQIGQTCVTAVPRRFLNRHRTAVFVQVAGAVDCASQGAARAGLLGAVSVIDPARSLAGGAHGAPEHADSLSDLEIKRCEREIAPAEAVPPIRGSRALRLDTGLAAGADAVGRGESCEHQSAIAGAS